MMRWSGNSDFSASTQVSAQSHPYSRSFATWRRIGLGSGHTPLTRGTFSPNAEPRGKCGIGTKLDNLYELKGGKAFHASFIGRKALKDLGGPLSPVANGGQFPPNLRLILSVPCPNGPASFPQINRPGRWRLSNRQQRLQRVHRRRTSFAEEDTKLLEPTQDFSLSDYSRPRSHLPSPVFHPPLPRTSTNRPERTPGHTHSLTADVSYPAPAQREVETPTDTSASGRPVSGAGQQRNDKKVRGALSITSFPARPQPNPNESIFPTLLSVPLPPEGKAALKDSHVYYQHLDALF